MMPCPTCEELRARAEMAERERDCLSADISSMRVGNQMLLENWEGATRRIGDLQEKMDDWANSWRMAMDEKCTADEAHCTCVPALRIRVNELTKAANDLRACVVMMTRMGWDITPSRIYDMAVDAVNKYPEDFK